jgi:hypothetical protein
MDSLPATSSYVARYDKMQTEQHISLGLERVWQAKHKAREAAYLTIRRHVNVWVV